MLIDPKILDKFNKNLKKSDIEFAKKHGCGIPIRLTDTDVKKLRKLIQEEPYLTPEQVEEELLKIWQE